MQKKSDDMNNEQIKLISYNQISEDNKAEGIPDGVKMIKAPEFWEKGRYGEGIVIAIIDTGCDINHPDLHDRIVGVKNFTDDDNGQSDIVIDYVGHGTHVAGIIAANKNGTGIVGVAPKAKLLIIKALSIGGGSYSAVTKAINYAVNCKVDIISMSLGGKYKDLSLYKAIKKAVDHNILVVCAAGNDGDGQALAEELNYPAGYNEVISVGSVSYEKKASRFSSTNNEVDLLAPGQGFNGNGIISTAAGGGYVEMQGTSMAAPHVSGALALIKNWAVDEFKRELTEVEIYAQLIKRTIALGYDKSIEGNGMLYLDIEPVIEKGIS